MIKRQIYIPTARRKRRKIKSVRNQETNFIANQFAKYVREFMKQYENINAENKEVETARLIDSYEQIWIEFILHNTFKVVKPKESIFREAITKHINSK